MRAELPVFLALIQSWKKYTFGFDIVLNARTVGKTTHCFLTQIIVADSVPSDLDQSDRNRIINFLPSQKLSK